MNLMRTHVASHIINGDVPPDADRCVFCGDVAKASCKFNVNYEMKRKKKMLVVKENTWSRERCPAFPRSTNWGAAQKFSISNPSTNTFIQCPLCDVFVWKMNAIEHMKKAHENEVISQDLQEEVKMTQDELEALRDKPW